MVIVGGVYYCEVNIRVQGLERTLHFLFQLVQDSAVRKRWSRGPPMIRLKGHVATSR